MTLRWSTLGAAAWLGVHLLLLVALGLGLAWPLVDPLAVEHDPWHDHLVVGGTAEARAAALAAHLHAAPWHDHAPRSDPLAAAASDESQAQVMVVGAHEGAGGGAIGQAFKTLALPLLLTLAGLLWGSQAPARPAALPRPTALRRLDPPPRLPA